MYRTSKQIKNIVKEIITLLIMLNNVKKRSKIFDAAPPSHCKGFTLSMYNGKVTVCNRPIQRCCFEDTDVNFQQTEHHRYCTCL